ncbi:MAG: Nif3-like dinuclear metal center hexameric protein [Firmicutes bacterium]|nr:Nif3-like dinuclear metal center hexameric protein [Bacillota bacterium]
MTVAKVADVVSILESWAPREWADSWDNVGLLVGGMDRPAERILVALELTDPVLAEAEAWGAQLLVLHHPPIFKPLPALRFDRGAGPRLERLVRAGIGVYAAHTNLDVAPGGVNDQLAAAVGLQEPRVLKPTGEDRPLKLVTFVPRDHVDRVRKALSDAGAGVIGLYAECSFETPGTGTFRPLPGANPYLGTVGELERAEEVRLEMILPASRAQAAVSALLEAHPYEEVAYDLYPLQNPGVRRGHGRVGRLPQPMRLGELAERLKEVLRVPALRMVGDPERVVSVAATAPGSGASLIQAAAAAGAEVLIGGDIDHHDAWDALDAGLAVLDPGHFATEVLVLPEVARRLREGLQARGLAGEVRVAESGTGPFTFC